MIDLTKILARQSQSGPARVGIDVSALVAAPGYAPQPWQTATAFPAGAAGWAKPPVGMSPDLARVLALPRRPVLEEGSLEETALVQMMTERYTRGIPSGQCRCIAIQTEHGIPVENQQPCIVELLPVQAWALYEIGLIGGCLGAIGVGHGKTLLDIMSPLALPGCRKALLLVPPSLISQLGVAYQLIAQHFRVPSLVVHGHPRWDRIIAGQPVLHVLSYGVLQHKDSSTLVAQIDPDAVIGDECHKLRNIEKGKASATADRYMRRFLDKPLTRALNWSGSLTDGSIMDYVHLAGLVLREGSPLPIDRQVAAEWATAIDPSDFQAPAGELMRLCDPGEYIHAGYQRRLRQTYGVVSTRGAAVKSALIVTERTPPEMPEELQQYLRELRADMRRPDGEILLTQFDVLRCALQLACGFYYRWEFPPWPEGTERAGEVQQRADIDAWFAARKAWGVDLRDKLWDRSEHLDSPENCKQAAIRGWSQDLDGIKYEGSLPTWQPKAWPLWRQLRHSIYYESKCIRVDPFLAQDAADWGLSHRGIIWYSWRQFGRWISELSGLTQHAGGQDAERNIMREDGSRSIIASIKSHGTGRDGLQRLFCDQLIANPSPSPTQWEQVLGRLHRKGQAAAIVRADYYSHTDELERHFEKALLRAAYVEGTLGSDQKILGGISE